MAIPLNDNIRVLAPKPTDPRYFANDNIPWASVADVEDGIPLTERHEGLTVNIAGVEYWWKDGDWVVKLPDLSNKADLVGGKVPSTQLPSYVDDVVEVANFAGLPTTGEVGKIYITLDTNKTYRWTSTVYVEISAGVTDHTSLQNIGTNTHAQIDTHISNISNPHNVTKAQVGLSNVPNLSFSGSNTGDETTSSIQSKRPLKTIEGQSLEGIGNIDLSKKTQVEDEFYYDENNVLRPNISTYRQVELNNTSPIPIITLAFEPTFIQIVNINGKILTQNQYIYTAPNQLDLSGYNEQITPMTIEITYEHFINETDNTL